MKFNQWLIFALTLSYLLLLTMMAPASTLFWMMNRSAPDKITSQTVSGTLWRGAAEDVNLLAPDGHAVHLKHLEWNTHPFWLLLGQLPTDIEMTGEVSGSMTLHPDFSGANIRHLDVHVPMSLLVHFNPRLKMLNPGGVLALSCDRLVLHSGHYAGHCDVEWRNASFGLLAMTVGNYRGRIEGAGEHLDFRLDTESGQLELNGSGSWSASHFEFSGKARALERKQDLDPVLQLLGPSDASGFHLLKF